MDVMLDGMTSTQLAEWQAYDELEPFTEERADFRSAQIVQALWNINRNQEKHPNGWPLTDFVLPFGDSPWSQTAQRQSLEYQEMLITSWCATSNLIHEAKACP